MPRERQPAGSRSQLLQGPSEPGQAPTAPDPGETDLSTWTDQQLGDAHKTAIEIALAADRLDGRAVAALWQEHEQSPTLVWALARLPQMLILALTEREGLAIDPAGVLGDLIDRSPAMPDDPRGDTYDD